MIDFVQRAEMYTFIDIKKRILKMKNIKISCSRASELFTTYRSRGIYRYTRIENSITTIISRKKRGEIEIQATSTTEQVENMLHTRSHLTRSGQPDYPPSPCSLWTFTTDQNVSICLFVHIRREILWEIESGHAVFAIAFNLCEIYERAAS